MTFRALILLFVLPFAVVADEGLVNIEAETEPPLPDDAIILSLPETTFTFNNPWIEDEICGRKITVNAASQSISVNADSNVEQDVPTYTYDAIRTTPAIKIIGIGTPATATPRPVVTSHVFRMLESIYSLDPELTKAQFQANRTEALLYTVAFMTKDPESGWDEPYLNYLVTDMQAESVTGSGTEDLELSGGYTQFAYETPLPMFNDELVLIRIWSSVDPLNVRMTDYAGKLECGERCNFDIAKFVLAYEGTIEGRPDLTDVAADTFLVEFDDAAAAEQHRRGDPLTCYNLWKLNVKRNLLLGEEDMMHLLPIDIHLGFKSKDSFVGPLCGRAFMYSGDFTEVSWDNAVAVPARKLMNIPEVAIIPRHWDTEINLETALFTLVYVGQSDEFASFANEQEPYLHWMVSNIRGFDVSTGDCIVPYVPAIPLAKPGQMSVLLYKQEEHKMINPAKYSMGKDCSTHYRCLLRLADMAADHDLTLVTGVFFTVTPDPGAIVNVLDGGLVEKDKVCGHLASFDKEGRMLGSCLKKFQTWKMMDRGEHDNDMMRSKITEMCPDMGMDLSFEMDMGVGMAAGGEDDKGASAHEEEEAISNLKEKMMKEWEAQAERDAKEHLAKELDQKILALEEKKTHAAEMKEFMVTMYEWKDMVLAEKVKDVMDGTMDLDIEDEGKPSSGCMSEVASYLQGITADGMNDAGHVTEMTERSDCALHAKLYLLKSLQSGWWDEDDMDWTMQKKMNEDPLTSHFYIEMCKATGMEEKITWGTTCTADSMKEKMHSNEWFADKVDALEECMTLIKKWEDKDNEDGEPTDDDDVYSATWQS